MRASVVVIIAAVWGVTATGFARSPEGIVVSREEVSVTLEPDLVLHMTVGPFDRHSHTLKTCQVEETSFICLIDGRPFLGTDGQEPHAVLQNAFVVSKGKRLPLDVHGMYDPWVGEFQKTAFSAVAIDGGWAIRGCFSDGAGFYVAEWRVVDGATLRTILSGDEAIANTFRCSDPRE